MDEELMRAKWVLIAAFVFLISGCMTYTELEYLVFGHTTDARVVDAKLVDTSERRFRTTEKLRIDYQFTEPDGTARKGQQDLSPDRIEESAKPYQSGTLRGRTACPEWPERRTC